MISIEQTDKQIIISYYDEKGDVAFKKINIPKSEYYDWEYVDTKSPQDMRRADPVMKSWDGKPIKKVPCKFLSRWRIQELIDEQPDDFKNAIYSLNTPKKFFVDIETMIDGEFPDPKLAKQEITAISFAHENILCVLGTRPLDKQAIDRLNDKINEYITSHGYSKIEFSYKCYETEYDMLYTFFKKWMSKMPLVSGWNFINFDWQYMCNRCKLLGIDPSICSPTGKMGKPDMEGIQMPYHRLVVDYMELYKKWDRVLFHENATLNYVATAATGMGKIPYNGTLQDLYETDYEKYVYYNGIDSVLVKLIDDKISTMATFLAVGSAAKVEANQAFSSIALTETAMFHEAHLNRNATFPITKKNGKKEDYEGAFVFKPIPGIYDWVASFDFASLYPSIMRQFNISPESYLGKANSFEEIPDDPNIIKTATGAYFDGSKDSIFRSLLTDYYGQRKAAKKVMLNADDEYDRLLHLKEKILESR